MAGLPTTTVEHLELERAKQALSHGVVVGVADRAHRPEQAGAAYLERPVVASTVIGEAVAACGGAPSPIPYGVCVEQLPVGSAADQPGRDAVTTLNRCSTACRSLSGAAAALRRQRDERPQSASPGSLVERRSVNSEQQRPPRLLVISRTGGDDDG